MLILTVDSSATAASVALCDDSKLISEFFINTELTHSATLVPMINSLLSVCAKSVADIDLVAVTSGPGSFTGVRIGVSAVKGLSFDRDIPCMSVSTLESMAYNLLSTDCVVCAVMDARRNQVYNALFEISSSEVTRLCEDRAISIEELKTELIDNYKNKRIILVGDGTGVTVSQFADTPGLADTAPENLIMQRASSVALAVKDRLNKGEKPIKSSELLPSYLRLSQAERERKERDKNKE